MFWDMLGYFPDKKHGYIKKKTCIEDDEKAWKRWPPQPVVEGVRFPRSGFHMKEMGSNSMNRFALICVGLC